MNKKINTIFFIFLLIFLISAVSAASNENSTISADQNFDSSKISLENENTETLTVKDNDKIESETLTSKNSEETLSVSQTTEKTSSVVKKKTTLTAPDVKMYYKDGTKFTATLKYGKKVIQNAKIQIQINGQTYTKTTDSKGKVSINLNLNSGSYTVLTKCSGNSEFEPSSAKSTVTIKSTIKCSDLTKYYKNTKAYYSTFYDIKGKLLKNTAVKFKLNNKIYSVKTNSKGIGKLSINLNPGKYSISSVNPKTTETISKSITIKSLIETKDLTISEGNTGKFNVKILNSNGKVSPSKKVTLKVNGKSYTKTTDKNGIATLPISLGVGKYTITTEYDGLKSTNRITVNKLIKHSEFTHSFKIPNHVNVTMPYVFHNSVYSLKTGTDGIIKLPKYQYFAIQVGSSSYKFTTGRISGYDAINLGYKAYLIPFDNSGVKSDLNKNNLKGNGILIYDSGKFTEIEYRDTTNDNVEMFGIYADKGIDGFETLTYTKNDKITAKVNFKTLSFDEMGLKYSLSKFYGKTIYNLNYNDIDENSVKFANTLKPVEFSMFGSYVVGYISKEDVITSFSINKKEELEKTETISYGLSDKYRKNYGFEVLQSYTIVNEKITQKILEDWINVNSNYITKFGLMNLYGMHMASLETVWLADELAEKYSKDFNVKWKRGNTLTILGGINLDDTYLHILNADMGMEVKGEENNVQLFRLINSMNLPNLEDYSISKVAWRYMGNTTNSLDNVLNAMANGSFSITQLGEMIYIFTEDYSSAIILNSTSGVSDVIVNHANATYKGSAISTSGDCCGVLTIPRDILSGIKDTINNIYKGIDSLIGNAKPLSQMIYVGVKFALDKVLTGAPAVCMGLFSTMIIIQNVGTTFRDGVLNKKEWHKAMDACTFTRPGYFQGKKVFNIPNKNGGYDYIEVKIKNDLTLDRNKAVYISNGKTKQLTKSETYQYFDEEYCLPISMPTKYWDKSWNGG